MNKVTAIVPAAGAGSRFSKKKGQRKPFFIVKNKPILIHTLTALANSNRINNIVVVVHKDDITKCRGAIKKFGVNKVLDVIPGGATRFESVKRGLSRVPRDSGMILIHDGVRPLIDKRMISAAIKGCARFGASVCGVPVVSTVKSVRKDLIVKNTPDRSRLYIAQTPQVFNKDTISRAYNLKIRNSSRITDDSMLVERLGCRIKMVSGSYKNIKVTTPEDLVLMERLMR